MHEETPRGSEGKRLMFGVRVRYASTIVSKIVYHVLSGMLDADTNAERLRRFGHDIFEDTRRKRSPHLLLVPVKDYARFPTEDMDFHDRAKRACEECALRWLGDLQAVSSPPPEELVPATFMRVFASDDGQMVVDAELIKLGPCLRLVEGKVVPLRIVSVSTEFTPQYVLCTNNLLGEALTTIVRMSGG